MDIDDLMGEGIDEEVGDEGQEAPAGFKRAAPFAEWGGSASPPGQGVKLPAGSRGRALAALRRVRNSLCISRARGLGRLR